MNKKVTIIDYGMGNILSLQRALRHVGATTLLSEDEFAISNAERLVLPGVGAFGRGIEEIKRRGIDHAINKYLISERPFLGICLGMQLLLTESFEFGHHKGLNIFPGKVIRLHKSESDQQLKIPQIGWNMLLKPSTRDHVQWSIGILNTISERDYMYFVHSFACYPNSSSIIIAETEYGRDCFCSVLGSGNVYGCQFHPERSGEKGLKILNNFVTEL
jgi:glutamine amidotransferase